MLYLTERGNCFCAPGPMPIHRPVPALCGVSLSGRLVSSSSSYGCEQKELQAPLLLRMQPGEHTAVGVLGASWGKQH